MKILITSIVDLRKSQHNRPHQFVKHLSKNHEVTVLSINDWWKGEQDDLSSYSSDFNSDFKNVEFVYLTDRKVSPILQEVFPSKRIKEVLKEDFDVHLNYSTLVSGYRAARKIPTVYDIADDLSAMIRDSPQIPRLLRPVGGILGDLMVRKNINLAKKVTITTDSLRQSCKIPNGKCEVIPNGVDVSHFKNYGDTKGELGLEGFIVGYVGVLREWVDLTPVYKALRDLDEEIKLLVVGKEGYFQKNVELAKEYGVSDRVTFTGMIPYSEVPKYISAMDVCLIPFKTNAISQNALPLKLFEYMACDKPVISTELPGVKAVAGDMVVYAEGRGGFKEKIRLLYEDGDLRRGMGESGRRFVEENYDWGKIIGNLEDLLRGIG